MALRDPESVLGVFPDRESVYKWVRRQLGEYSEDLRAGRRYMGKEGIEKISKKFFERKNKELILDETIIKQEAQNAIYTT